MPHKKKPKESSNVDEMSKTYCVGITEGNWLILEQCWDGKEAYFYSINKRAPNKKIDKCYEYKGEAEIIHVPIIDEFLRKGSISLPSIPMEYCNEAELFREIKGFIHKYSQIAEEYEALISAFVMLSWIYEKSPAVPIINFRGPPESGKTRMLEILKQICFRGLGGFGGLTYASLFRISDKWKGTLCIDEANLSNSSETAQIVKYLNMRYSQGGLVWRVNLNTFEVECFLAFGPTILATRKEFDDDALESRCFTIPMSERTRRDIPLNLPPAFFEEALMIRNKLLTFRFRNWNKFKNDYTLEFDNIGPRLNQIFQPIASLAKIVSKELFEILKTIAIGFQKKNTEVAADSVEGLIVRTFLKLEGEGIIEITASKIAEAIEDRYRERYSPQSIGKRLRALNFRQYHSKAKSKRCNELSEEQRTALIRKYVPLGEREELGFSETSVNNSAEYGNCEIIEIEEGEIEKDSKPHQRKNRDGA